MLDSYHCPKCGAQLARSGIVPDVETGEACPVFQCDHCTVNALMFGKPFEVAVTFAVDGAGSPFDPASDEIF